MNKKILIGSIIAVVILVLVSFTGVVGYQTTKSSTIARASPLFSVRSKRAIDKQSKDIACEYVGKGEESVLSIPKRDDKTAIKQKVVDMICAMDDITFNKLMNLVASKFQQKEERNEVINTFHQLRSHPERISVDYDNNNERFTSITKYLICLILAAIPWAILAFILILFDRLTIVPNWC